MLIDTNARKRAAEKQENRIKAVDHLNKSINRLEESIVSSTTRKEREKIDTKIHFLIQVRNTTLNNIDLYNGVRPNKKASNLSFGVSSVDTIDLGYTFNNPPVNQHA